MKELFTKQLDGAVEIPFGNQRPSYTFFGTPIGSEDKVLYAAYVESVTVPTDRSNPSKVANMPISLFIPVLESDFDSLGKMFVQVDIKQGVTDEATLEQLSTLDGFPFFINRSRQLSKETQSE